MEARAEVATGGGQASLSSTSPMRASKARLAPSSPGPRHAAAP